MYAKYLNFKNITVERHIALSIYLHLIKFGSIRLCMTQV